ncbi:unnamed protein product [Urochloa decumbens]|uniref:Protein kinase domain-containing protein n=1 Tax=Urochloa decumbens TaxID=240449 RepID=A0ABC9CGL4_9POAL
MADPLGSLEKIVKLALTIKEAVDTVRQNKEECQQIRTRAVRVSSLLSRLPETGMAADPAMCDALEDLEDSLRRAHMLVAACQESTTTTIILTNIRIGAVPPVQVVGEMIETPVAVPSHLSADDSSPAPVRPLPAVLLPGLLHACRAGSPSRHRPGQCQGASAQHIRQQPWRPAATALPHAHNRRRAGSSCWEASMRTSWNANGRCEEEDETNNIPTGNESPSVPSLAGKMWPIIHIGGRFKFFRRLVAGTFPAPSTHAPSAQGLPVRPPPHGEVVVGHPLLPPLKPPSLSIAVINEVKKAEKGLASRDVDHSLSASDSCLRKSLFYCLQVKLIGYANVGAKEDKGTSYFFVEEYMPNGSLNKIINGLQLDWSSRFLLIQGIAQGLCYLHKENVVHLDVKPSNVFLDSDMNPKITDFGIARVLNHKGVDICADIGTIAGTLGYMPPEYITDGTLSKKQDVYGFGVTLLEIISGMSRFKSASGQASIQWAWKARQAGGTMELPDPSRFDELQLKEIERCVEVGLLCTQFDPTDRPGMVDALEMLCGEKALRIPVRPGYTKEPTSWFGGWRCLR